MVDRWLIAVRHETKKVMRGGEDHQERNQGDSDPEPNFLSPLAQGASPEGLESVEREVPAVQQRYRQQIHQADRH